MYEYAIIYRRPVPRGMIKEGIKMLKPVETGIVLEFKYGFKKQMPGETGSYKNDPRPTLLVFYDDGHKYVEGININYLSRYYLIKVRQIVRKFPGITKDGRIFYKVIKMTASYAVKKGYRKYLRQSIREAFLHIYEPEVD